VSVLVFTRRLALTGLWTIGSILFLSSFILAAAAEEEIQEDPESNSTSWYVSAVVSGRSGYRVTHYWSTGSNMRAHTLVGIHPITTIVRGDRYWVYDELLKEGIEIKRSALAVAEDTKRIRPFGNDLEELVHSNGEKVETGRLSGVPAETWRVTDATGRRTVWVTVSEPKVPLRVENFDRESGDSAILNYSNWTSNINLPEITFEPPADLLLQKFEYEQFVEKALEGLVGPAPILYPKLLHGSRSR
jgi:outer membrane lipoprotein-sorting protein